MKRYLIELLALLFSLCGSCSNLPGNSLPTFPDEEQTTEISTEVSFEETEAVTQSPATEKTTGFAETETEKPGPQATGLYVEVVSKTRYIGTSLTAMDFKVYQEYDNNTKTLVNGWAAFPLELSAESNTVTVKYGDFTKTVTIKAVEKPKETEAEKPTEQETTQPLEKTVVKVTVYNNPTTIYAGVATSTRDIYFTIGIEYSDGSVETANTGLESAGYWEPSIETFTLLDVGDKISYSIKWREYTLPVTVTATAGYSRKLSYLVFEKICEYRLENGLPLCTWDEDVYQYLAARAYDWYKDPNYAHSGNWLLYTELLTSGPIYADMNNIKDKDFEEAAINCLGLWQKSPGHNQVLLRGDTGYAAVGIFVSPGGYFNASYSISDFTPTQRANQYGAYEKYQKYLATCFSLGEINHSEYRFLYGR